jgi:hypothetical protein
MLSCLFTLPLDRQKINIEKEKIRGKYTEGFTVEKDTTYRIPDIKYT